MSAFKPIRWTIEQASNEFGLDRQTLAKRINNGGILPGDDKKFSTADICRAVFGDIESEKLREVRHRANLLEIDEKERLGQLTPTHKVEDWIDKTAGDLKINIMASNLSEDEKRDLLKTLQASVEKI